MIPVGEVTEVTDPASLTTFPTRAYASRKIENTVLWGFGLRCKTSDFSDSSDRKGLDAPFSLPDSSRPGARRSNPPALTSESGWHAFCRPGRNRC